MMARRGKTDVPKRSSYTHTFVELMPDNLDEGVLYVCIRYATAAHKCFCGCGREIVTPLHPTKWKLTFDGVHVSLFPSIGSWSLPCKSHYVLRNGSVLWGAKFSDEQIEAVRMQDVADQGRYFGKQKQEAHAQRTTPQREQIGRPERMSMFRRVADWLRGN